MNALLLPGCSPTPLAHYLKALGVLRLLSEQLPAGVPRPRGAWQGEAFVLHTTLDRSALEKFFLHDYRPTPILAPWNGGSGFYFREGKSLDPNTGKRGKTGQRTAATEATKTLNRIQEAKAERFQPIVNCVALCREILRHNAHEAAPKDEEKAKLLLTLRGSLPPSYVEVLDAAYVLLSDDAKPPPLLGTGLNDGNLDFSNNFIQRIIELFDPATGKPASNTSALLSGSLFGEPTRGLTENAIGQFFPHAAGGANSTSGFDGKSLVNPWDFVLMLEGALLFAAAAVKRLEAAGPGELAYPFSVRPSGFGYASSTGDAEGARCELWAPLWQQPASLTELRHVLGEGRAQLRDRGARDGFEFARAVAGLGIDRGLSSFQRYSFAPRNGLAFFATPLDRISVRRHLQATELLDDLDRGNWLDRVRRAGRDDRAPNRVVSAVRQLEQAALALLRSSQREAEEHAAVESLLLAVADTEAAFARSLRWTKEKGLQPVPMLNSQWWESLPRAQSAELDLAAGLAALKKPLLRVHWEPLDVEKPFPAWDENSREVVWQDALLEETLLAIHQRRIILQQRRNISGSADGMEMSVYAVSPANIARFLDGQTDDQRLARLGRALSLVQLPLQVEGESQTEGCEKLPALFALPRLALAGVAPDSNEAMPRLTSILRRGVSSDGLAATRLAAQRLRGSGFTPALREVPAHGRSVRRAIAATLFPLSRYALKVLADQFRPLKTTN